MTPQDIGTMLERTRAACQAFTEKFTGMTITQQNKEIVSREIAMLEMEWKLDGTTVCPMLAFERAAKLQHLRAYLAQWPAPRPLREMLFNPTEATQ
jgi:hypothetical protein